MKNFFSKLEELDGQTATGVKLCQAFCFQEEQTPNHMSKLIRLIVKGRLPADEEAFYEADYPDALVNLLCEDECDDTEDLNLRAMGWEWLGRRDGTFFRIHRASFEEHFTNLLGSKENVTPGELLSVLGSHPFFKLVKENPGVLSVQFVVEEYSNHYFEQPKYENPTRFIFRLFYLEYLLNYLEEESTDTYADLIDAIREGHYGYFDRSAWRRSTSDLSAVKILLLDRELENTVEGLILQLRVSRADQYGFALNSFANWASHLKFLVEDEKVKADTLYAFELVKDQLKPLLRQTIQKLWHTGGEKEGSSLPQLSLDSLRLVTHTFQSIPALNAYWKEVLDHPWMTEVEKAIREPYPTMSFPEIE